MGITAAAATSLLFFVCSCSPRIYPTEKTDSVRVEIRERLIRDTALLEIPVLVEKQITRDTASHLENAYAESDAVVDSLGYLHHSLSSRPQIIRIPVAVTVHDTTVVERQSETVVQEVNVLTRLQKGWISFGKVAAGILAGLILALVGWIVLKVMKYI